jgi:hypothetical protein
MKKEVIFILTILILLPFLTAIDNDPGQTIDSKAGQIEDGIEDIENQIEDTKEKATFDYLSNEWKNIMLKNKIAQEADKTLTKFSTFFQIFFGMPYSLSIILFFVIILWIMIIIDIGNIINAYDIGNGIVPYLASTAIAIILAQTMILKNIVILAGKVIFLSEHSWTRFFIFLIFVAGFLVIQHFSKMYSKFIRKQKTEKLKIKARNAQQSIISFSDYFRKARKIAKD